MGRVTLSLVMQRAGVLVREKHYTWSDYEPIGRTAQPHQRNHSLQQHNVDRRHHGWQPLAPLFSTTTSFKLLLEPTVNLMHHKIRPVLSSYKSIKLYTGHSALRGGVSNFFQDWVEKAPVSNQFGSCDLCATLCPKICSILGPKNGPKWPKMTKNRFDCSGRPKRLVQLGSWVAQV